jgi:transcriptional regulator with XRE-family HTH domain
MIEDMSRPDRSQPSAFGQRLRSLREAAGLTQKQLADQLGISQPSYLAWEAYNVALKPDQIEQLASVLDVEIADLFDSPKRKKPAKRGPPGKTEQVFQSVAKLPRHKQQRILGVVEALVAQVSAA